MRQRTKVREFWRVYHSRCGELSHTDRDDHDKAVELVAWMRKVKHYDDVCGPRRVTVYRVAKLRELPEWTHDGRLAFTASNAVRPSVTADVWASVGESGWSWSVVHRERVISGRERTKAAAMCAAEDALAWLGYRVAKGDR